MSIQHCKHFGVVLLLLLVQMTMAQHEPVDKVTHQIDSKAFDKERTITVYLPPAYEASQDNSYGVIYVFDGQFDAMVHMISAMNIYLSNIGSSEFFIVVGIHTENRPLEFTPSPVDAGTADRWGPEAKVGGSEQMDQHLREEVFPLVEATYRTTPYRLAIGHSLGGTYVLNAITQSPDFFKTYIAVSPNLDYDKGAVLDRLEAHLEKRSDLNALIYTSIGDQGGLEKLFLPGVKRLDALLTGAKTTGLKHSTRYLNQANHSTFVFKTLPEALLEVGMLFAKPGEEDLGHMLKQANFTTALKAYYEHRSQWLGYEFLPGEWTLNDVAYHCHQLDRTLDAVEVLDWALTLYPNGINLYDSMGEMQIHLGHKEKAKSFYEEGLKKLSLHKDQFSPEDYAYFSTLLQENMAKIK